MFIRLCYKQTWPHPSNHATLDKPQTPTKQPIGEDMGFGDRQNWVQIFLSPLVTSCVYLDKLLNFSELDFLS